MTPSIGSILIIIVLIFIVVLLSSTRGPGSRWGRGWSPVVDDEKRGGEETIAFTSLQHRSHLSQSLQHWGQKFSAQNTAVTEELAQSLFEPGQTQLTPVILVHEYQLPCSAVIHLLGKTQIRNRLRVVPITKTKMSDVKRFGTCMYVDCLEDVWLPACHRGVLQ